MITYELALKLREAKFPKDSSVCTQCEYPGYDDRPNLSELIEACKPFERDFPDGDTGYFRLYYQSEDLWIAGFYSYDISKIDGDGVTPEEAVAKLWLSINKK